MNVRPFEVLLVEDNPGDVLLSTEALEEAKLHINMSIVSNGVEALDYLYRRSASAAPRPDLMLLDLNMPRKDGREVLAEIKTDPDLRGIPVVVLTTSHAEQDIVRTYNLHANAYVTKPVDLEQFIAIVHAINQFWFTIVALPPH